MRINKYCSQKGICSRREAESYIKQGKLRVNGEVVHDLGRQIDPNIDVVEIVGIGEGKMTVAYNKPRGISSSKIASEGTNIFDLLPQFSHLNTIGRLDKDSQGLILLSNDGVLTKIITGDDHRIEKEYVVTVRETVTPELITQFGKGVQLEDGPTLPAKTTIINEHTFSLTLKEGRKHQIRRMANAANLTIEKLERVRVGDTRIDGLQEGEFRELTKDEIKKLKDMYPESNPR